MRRNLDHRLLAFLLLAPTLACADDDLASRDDDSAREDDGTSDDGDGDGAPSDVVFEPITSEMRGLHRSRITVGTHNACAVIGDGTVRCWGDGSWGQLGNGGGFSSTTPVTVSGLTDVVALDSGSGQRVMALRSNGTVWRWGTRNGLLVNGGQTWDTTPQQIPGLADIVSIGAGLGTDCAVRADGRVFCWGHGYLGDGDEFKRSDAPVQVSGIDTAVATNGACVLLANGTVKCWGTNEYGQVGDGTVVDALTPVSVSGIGNAIAIADTGKTRYAVLADGTVRSWGYNGAGALGTGLEWNELPYATTPLDVIGLAGVRTLDGEWETGGPFVCAALHDGSARCWGSNMEGVLGIGSADDNDHATPEPPTSLEGVVDIDGNSYNACAALADGSMHCWGDNASGALGNGTYLDSHTPVEVVGLDDANDGTRVATGMFHTCGLRGDGTVKCWGDNGEGQLGDGTLVDRSSATLVAGLANAIDVEAGGRHTCALVDDGTARCWGRNASGELGDDSASGIRSSAPVVVQGLDDVTQLAAAEESTCAIRSDGTGVCWGSNTYGQLGDGTHTSSDVPVPISGLANMVAIDATRYHVCALGSGGQVRCWGSNAQGQLGNGSSGVGAKSNVPVTVRLTGLLHPPLGNVVGIATGNLHSCAVLASGSATCWGAGFDGALGHGAWTSSSYPVSVAGLTNAFEIAAGSSSSCALKGNGTARCWGTNNYGELGNDDDDGTNTPVTVGPLLGWLGNAVAIDSGYDHTCVAKSGGTIACWGRNDNGQLGDGTTTNRDIPVAVLSFP